MIEELISNRKRLQHMAEMAQKRIEDWSPEANVEALVEAVKKAIRFKRHLHR